MADEEKDWKRKRAKEGGQVTQGCKVAKGSRFHEEKYEDGNQG